MRALITGMTGFVGRHLAEHLRAMGDEVLGCSRGELPRDGPAKGNDAPRVPWDIAREDGLSAAERQRIGQFAPDCVYHLAGVAVPSQCGRQQPTPDALAANVDGTRRVLELAAVLPSRPRVLFVSSARVYAPPIGFRVNEHAPLGPSGAYGQTKLAAEELVWNACRERGLDAVVARSFQHAGAGQSELLMLSQWARQFAAGASPVEVHNLTTWMDLSDVRDAARAYRLLVRHGRTATAYNVGSGSRQQSGDIFHLLRRLADPHRPFVELFPGDRHELIADVTRLRQDTNWRPRWPISETVARTYEYWKSKLG